MAAGSDVHKELRPQEALEKPRAIRYTQPMPRKPSADNAPKRSSTNVRWTIGANVKARRLTLGWSQQELADRFGVSRATVSQYEIGTGEVNAGDLPRLAEILGIGLLDFYGYAPPVSAARVERAKEKSGNDAEPDENVNHDENAQQDQNARQNGASEDHASEDRAGSRPAAGAAPGDDSPLVDVAPDVRQIEFYDKADCLYVSDYDNHVIGSLGKAVADADREAILPLLRSILDLAPGDRETVRRVVQAMRGGTSPGPGRR